MKKSLSNYFVDSLITLHQIMHVKYHSETTQQPQVGQLLDPAAYPCYARRKPCGVYFTTQYPQVDQLLDPAAYKCYTRRKPCGFYLTTQQPQVGQLLDPTAYTCNTRRQPCEFYLTTQQPQVGHLLDPAAYTCYARRKPCGFYQKIPTISDGLVLFSERPPGREIWRFPQRLTDCR